MFKKGMNKLNARLDTIMSNITKEFTDRGLEVVKQKTPVRTGLLRDSWTKDIQPLGKVSSISNPQPYASYVENGSATVTPNKMARQTVQQLVAEASSLVKKAT